MSVFVLTIKLTVFVLYKIVRIDPVLCKVPIVVQDVQEYLGVEFPGKSFESVLAPAIAFGLDGSYCFCLGAPQGLELNAKMSLILASNKRTKFNVEVIVTF